MCGKAAYSALANYSPFVLIVAYYTAGPPSSLSFGRVWAPLWVGTTSVWFNVAFPALFATIWRPIDRRLPPLGFGSVFLALLVLMLLVDIVQELLELRMGLYSYLGASHQWCIFGGHYYQFPLFSGTITACFFMVVCLIVRFRNDKGLCCTERGAGELGVSRRHTHVLE